jgi:hypothetical protein
MRGIVPSLSHVCSILLISLLVLSTHVLWAQRTSTLEESAVQLPDAPSRVSTVSEAQTHLHLTYKGLPLSFKQNQSQTEGTAELWGKNKCFIGSAPTKWMTFAPTFGHVHHETIHGANDLEYYGHHIPWAGSVILRIGQQAKTHPHITSVVKTLHPQF